MTESSLNDMHNPFHSFWMAGFECTDKMNAFGNRVDFLTITDHINQAESDYQRLSVLNMQTVREGIRWSVVERQPYVYDWSAVEKLIIAGRNQRIQQVWDLSHFGYPDDLTPLHPMFARRFAALCSAFAQFFRKLDPVSTLIVTPFNEVGFISWLGGEVCGTVPYCRNYGWEVKYALMKAYIEGIEALKTVDSNIRILVTEPLVNIVPPLDFGPDELLAAAKAHTDQFQVFDMLSGRTCPELRGKPEYLDIIGCNFYHNNQWMIGTFELLPWANELNDPRWVPLSELIRQVYHRYGRPIILAETSHPGEHKANWLQFIADQALEILNNNIPFWGICWYPIIDRPDWDHLEPWHNAGLWDVEDRDNECRRVLDMPTANALIAAQKLITTSFQQPLIQQL